MCAEVGGAVVGSSGRGRTDPCRETLDLRRPWADFADAIAGLHLSEMSSAESPHQTVELDDLGLFQYSLSRARRGLGRPRGRGRSGPGHESPSQSSGARLLLEGS